MSPYLPAEIWKRASPPNKYRVAIRATYRLMEIPEPTAAESFWTLPNHQFSNPLLLRNPRTSSRCLAWSFPHPSVVPLFPFVFRNRSTRFYDFRRALVKYPAETFEGKFLPRGKDRCCFFNFYTYYFGGGGGGLHILSYVSSSMREISVIMLHQRTLQTWRRRFPFP